MTASSTPIRCARSVESQDSLAFPVSASYHVNELYSEFSLSAAQESGCESAYVLGLLEFRQPRRPTRAGSAGSPSRTLRFAALFDGSAPDLGELYGLTQFAATPHRSVRSDRRGAIAPKYVAGCTAQGVPPGFTQANTQNHDVHGRPTEPAAGENPTATPPASCITRFFAKDMARPSACIRGHLLQPQVQGRDPSPRHYRRC